MTNLEIIKAACIKANPEIVGRFSGRSMQDNSTKKDTIYLADVLVALGPLEGSLGIDKDGLFIIPTLPKLGGWEPARRTCPVWNIYKDSLEEQSEETLQFLADLLK